MDNQLSSKIFRGLASDFICHHWTTVGGVRVCEIKRRSGCGVCEEDRGDERRERKKEYKSD